MHVLIVDDIPSNLYLMQSLLSSQGYRVSCAADGNEALRIVQSDPVDLVISDILMPGMDGYQLCRSIKKLDAHKDIPVVFYTATYTDAKDEAFGLSLGACRFLTKPVEPEVLLAVVEEVMKAPAAQETPATAPVEDDSVFLREYNQRLIHKLESKMLELEAQKESYRTTLDAIGDAVVSADLQGQITLMNPAAEALTGWRIDDVRGRPLCDVFRLMHVASVGDDCEKKLEELLRSERLNSVERLASEHAWLIQRGGGEVAVAFSQAPICDSDGKASGCLLVFRDVTEKHEMAQQLAYHSTHDTLTGALNRAEFELRLWRVLPGQGAGGHHALLYLDLDQFKVVNDTCGHIAGDTLLQRIVGLLAGKLRRRDTLARLGGDEFGVLLEDCTREQALHIADELRRAINDLAFFWEGSRFQLGVSIGMVPIPDGGETLTEVLSAADSACYSAKAMGRNRVQVFEPHDSDIVQRRSEMQWLPRIHHALSEDRFELYFQPIQALHKDADAEAPRIEILLRLIDESGAVIAPGLFIPAAERYDQMQSIDRWVVARSLALQAEQARSGTPYHYDINISGQSLSDPTFLEYVLAQLQQSGVDPSWVGFEITETAAIANLTQALRFMGALKNLGCHFALDDFGNGLSSFNYLKNLPVDFLKIDGGFVRGIVDSPVDRTMVQAIHSVGASMQIRTIAEYVENAEILDLLKALGVDYAQGYGVAPPRPLRELLSLGG